MIQQQGNRRPDDLDAPKPWSDLTTDEKVERLRESLRSRDSYIQGLQSQIYALMNHVHGEHGALLVPAHSAAFGCCAPQPIYDPLA